MAKREAKKLNQTCSKKRKGESFERPIQRAMEKRIEKIVPMNKICLPSVLLFRVFASFPRGIQYIIHFFLLNY